MARAACRAVRAGPTACRRCSTLRPYLTLMPASLQRESMSATLKGRAPHTHSSSSSGTGWLSKGSKRQAPASKSKVQQARVKHAVRQRCKQVLKHSHKAEAAAQHTTPPNSSTAQQLSFSCAAHLASIVGCCRWSLQRAACSTSASQSRRRTSSSASPAPAESTELAVSSAVATCTALCCCWAASPATPTAACLQLPPGEVDAACFACLRGCLLSAALEAALSSCSAAVPPRKSCAGHVALLSCEWPGGCCCCLRCRAEGLCCGWAWLSCTPFAVGRWSASCCGQSVVSDAAQSCEAALPLPAGRNGGARKADQQGHAGQGKPPHINSKCSLAGTPPKPTGIGKLGDHCCDSTLCF